MSGQTIAARILERVNQLDLAWFMEHPDQWQLLRPIVPGEFDGSALNTDGCDGTLISNLGGIWVKRPVMLVDPDDPRADRVMPQENCWSCPPPVGLDGAT